MLIRQLRFRAAVLAAISIATIVTAVTVRALQAPEPGPLLTDPQRGELRMLLDKQRLGSSEVAVAERTYRANYESTEHTHQGLEIIYVVQGEFQHVINGKAHVLRPGGVGIVRPGDKVRHRTGSQGPVKTLMIWVPGDEGTRVAEGWPGQKPR
jgi:quercetin dioxygenase-like cupin family protein